MPSDSTPIDNPSHTPPHLAEPVLTTATEASIDDRSYARAFSRGFHEQFRDEEFALERPLVDPSRMIGHQVDGRWISTTGSFARVMTTPGGTVPVAAVTVVTVSPGYRRRGLLRQLMTTQLNEVSERGDEPIALLWASEALIYGRFGYGCTTSRLRLSGRTRSTAFLPEVALAAGSVDEVGREEFVAIVPRLRESWLPDRPGHLDRSTDQWTLSLYDADHRRHGGGELRFVLHYDADGRPDGFATFRVKESGSGDGDEVMILELDAAAPATYAALWRWLLDLDLVRSFSRFNAPTDEPLRQLVADQRAIKSELGDGTYARILDVPRALAARRYPTEVAVNVELLDTFLPDLAGRYRFTLGPDGAEVNRTDQSPDLTLSVRQLGGIYLGGTSLTTLHRAGLVVEHTAGAVLATSAAFSSPREPFCPDFF